MPGRGVPALVLTSDPTNWCLGPMAYLWNKYISPEWPVLVCGFTQPDFALPDNFRFRSLGKFEDYPAKRWGAALRQAVELMVGEPFIFLLEDHWPIRYADQTALRLLGGYLAANEENILRIDLTADRLFARNADKEFAARDVASLVHLDLIETKAPVEYLMSTQAAIWSAENLLPLIKDDESPWEFELMGSQRVRDSGLRVLGTRNYVLRHTVAVRRGRLDLDAAWMWPPSPVKKSDITAMIQTGVLSADKLDFRR